jgi:hypothetical protein
VRVMRRESCVCTALYAPVCGADGQTYSNSCAAGCAGAAIASEGECRRESWIPVARTIESAHPYTNNFRDVWTVREAGARAIRVRFARLETERGYDFVRLLDGSDRVVASYTGTNGGFTSPVIQGDTVKVVLETDRSVTGWGFAIDQYEVVGGCSGDADCAGGRCVQVQCLRAPCFAVCEAGGGGGGGTAEVTLDDLRQNAQAYNGQKVRVVAEPLAFGAACTRRACPASNPCCNACSASFRIGETVELRDAAGQPYGCSGNECSWREGCREFRAEGGGRYALEGTFSIDEFGTSRLALDRFQAADCQRSGCGGEVCANTSMASACVVRPEHACYQAATCGAQASGHCGWTETDALRQCLAGNTARTYAAAGLPAAIPDANASGFTSTVEVSGAAAGARVRVSVNVSHPYRGDLVVTLLGPGGRSLVLHDKQGGSADDVVIADQEVPAAVAGAINGRWQLRVVDTARDDAGRLTSFSLSVN